MTNFANIRRIALALVISVTLMVAIVPFCQVVACHGMPGPMSGSSPAEFAATCTAAMTGAFSSGVIAENSLTTVLALSTVFVAALTFAAPSATSRIGWLPAIEIPPPNEGPIGVRLIV